ncbi:UDP-N-acetylmuramoyl-L-alanine--D-glutamate ligase [Leptospira sp. GIMC2001]|uniref:UDP-N-acetylmuramoyl-L-alanine--D-glutamate ligase n=1 Tax=Leptospira sp. GIMC2001 TaxID=1513297 RepID=UPI00234BA0D0|nr:UDP-N-acetylmuramoyl-L-alanine--D-glutamate ligase [Leptospira sp. GIMC2001]WCL50489.1 UDP-N-acetylmuramoyl-L-alanine--D-glutamate ligase [Leptospira sp. GIMC2001]
METEIKKSFVLGGGISGLAALNLLSQKGFSASLVDRSAENAVLDTEELASKLLKPEDVDKIVKSPGVSPSHPWLVLARERGISIISEIDLAKSFYKNRILGITGTDGKSTTTALTAHLLKTNYPTVVPGGNIGKAFSEICLSDHEMVVLELSSYQLEDSQSLNLESSAILNIAPDHLERHGNLENYIRAKVKIVDQNNPDHHLITKNDTWLQISPYLENCKCKIWKFGFDPDSDAFIYLEKKIIRTRNYEYSFHEFSLEGTHNYENLAAAILLAESMSADPESIADQIKTFQGLNHRFEKVLKANQWNFINDSKSTNLHSLLAWLENYDLKNGNLHLLLGGRPKGESMEHLVSILQKIPGHFYIYGEARTQWKKDFQILGNRVSYPETMTEALIQIRSLWTRDPESMNQVILSPACASFDQFKNFEERGNHFKSLITALFSGVE